MRRQPLLSQVASIHPTWLPPARPTLALLAGRTQVGGWELLKYRICAIVVLLLVLVTLGTMGLVGAQSLAEWRAASALLDVPSEPPQAALAGSTTQAASDGVPAPTAQGADLGSVFLWSMVLDILIFIGLGLFLRLDSDSS